MRLIDADDLLKEFDPDGAGPVDAIKARAKVIQQPTAYDVKKVVRKLERYAEKATRDESSFLNRVGNSITRDVISDSIKIVKGSGTDRGRA